jgi:UDP-4-amino-4,6-dideoxy-N-acetyl-beta-L-altrosamine N-acetyltransferase
VIARAAGGVVLRELTADDGELIVAWRQNPAIALQLFGRAPETVDAHRHWFESMREVGTRHEFVILWPDGGPSRPVGTVGLTGIDHRHRRAEYGVLIGESSARRRGVAFEASRLILEYAFGELNLHRVFLQVFADNVPAIKLYERLGFLREGLLRDHATRDGVPYDVVVMGLLASELRAAGDR